MNIKYKDLSIICKVWSIAELFYAGIRDKNKKYVEVAFSKLESLKTDDIALNSKAVAENGIENLIENAKTDKQLMLGEEVTGGLFDDASIISTIWFNRLELDAIKNRIKNNCLMEEDIPALKNIYLEIKRIWLTDLKAKQLSSAERRDLYKITEELKALVTKIEKRAKHNQITII